MVLRLWSRVTSVWTVDDHCRDEAALPLPGAIKDQISGYEGGAKSAQLRGWGRLYGKP